MKKLKNYLSSVMLVAIACFAMSCDDNDEIKVDPNADYDAVLDVKEGGATNPNDDVEVNANIVGTIKAKVSFTSTSKSMTRLYITQNVKGEGDLVYKPTESIDLKGDGSVDIEASKKNFFEYAFTLPVPAGVGTGTVVYKFWTTDGNGDFRDVSKRLAVGPGTITLKYGTAANPVAPVKSFSAKILAAPLADGSSATFMSLFDGKIYKINEGSEYAKLWDFGYYYTSTDHASLASTFNYETAFPFVNVDGIAGTTDLNKIYFATTTKTSAEFTAIEKAQDLSFVTTATAQSISNLAAGSIVQFTDNYGKKGLIRVVEVVGTTGSGDYIKIDVKVQP